MSSSRDGEQIAFEKITFEEEITGPRRACILEAMRITGQELQLKDAAQILVIESLPLGLGASVGDSDSVRSAMAPTAPLFLDRAQSEVLSDDTVFRALGADASFERMKSFAVFYCPRCETELFSPNLNELATAAGDSSGTVSGMIVSAFFPLRRKGEERTEIISLLRFLAQQGSRTFLARNSVVRLSEDHLMGDQLTGNTVNEVIDSVLMTFLDSSGSQYFAVCPVLTLGGSEAEIITHLEQAKRLGATALVETSGHLGERIGDALPFEPTSTPRIISDRFRCPNCHFFVSHDALKIDFTAIECGTDEESADEATGRRAQKFKLFGLSREDCLSSPLLELIERAVTAVAPLAREAEQACFDRLEELGDFLRNASLGHIPGGRYLSQLSHGERIKLYLVSRAIERPAGIRFYAEDLFARFPREEIPLIQSLLQRISENGSEITIFQREEISRYSLSEGDPNIGAKPHRYIPEDNACHRDWIHELATNGPTVLRGAVGSGKTTLLKKVIPALLAPQKSTKAQEMPAKFRYLDFHSRPQLRQRRELMVVSELKLESLIGKHFYSLPDSKRHGFTGADFHPRTSRLRCPRCDGLGVLVDNLDSWEATVNRCPQCFGTCFQAEILTVRYQQHSVADLLDTELARFQELFPLNSELSELSEIALNLGIGMLKLNAPMNTISERVWRAVTMMHVLLTALNGNPSVKTAARGRRGKSRSATVWLLDQPFLSATPSESKYALHQMEIAGKRTGEQFVLSTHSSLSSGGRYHTISL